MRGSLDKRDALVAKALDEELRRSATKASMARSRITVGKLEDIRLSYDIPTSVTLRAPGLEESTDDPPEGFVVIYEPTMQQGLHLPVHHFFHEVLRDWNLAPCQITPNGWGLREATNLEEGQGELRTKWNKVRALTSDFRSLSNLLKNDNLLASCGLVGPGCHTVKDNPSSILQGLGFRIAYCSFAQLSSSNLRTDSILPRDKGNKIVEDAGKVAAQKMKAHAVAEGFMKDACKAKQTQEGRRSSPPPNGEPEDAGNSASSVGQGSRICISQHCDELPTSVMEMLLAHPAIMAASVHKYWIQRWENATKEATIREWLQLVEMNLVRGFVLAKELFGTIESFDAEEVKSKKHSEDLKAMSLEKAQLDLVVKKEKRAEEAQKSAEDLTLTAETTLVTANNSLDVVVEKQKSLAVTKQEVERVRAEQADAEAKAVEAYQDPFVDTSEYQDLTQRLMTIGGADHGNPSRVGYLLSSPSSHRSSYVRGCSRR
ncbi:Uncharacterized protein Adt_21631 [Abeliophyllum distichum]|uniref:Transposase (putative) gypsy type domain-containing protein n=1 Tax=Abeliophyllum distichum TaxID=126358 RepID=A0ABD1SZX2_9LAMI